MRNVLDCVECNQTYVGNKKAAVLGVARDGGEFGGQGLAKYALWLTGAKTKTFTARRGRDLVSFDDPPARPGGIDLRHNQTSDSPTHRDRYQLRKYRAQA